MQIRKPEEYKTIFTESKLIGYDAVLLIARDLFFSREALVAPWKWEEYLSSLGEEKQKRLGDFIYFYYHMVRPWEANDGSHTIRDESRLVAITSMMEKLMSTEEHLDFFQWFKQRYPSQNSIEDLNVLKEKYLTEFGVHKKFKKYLSSYIVDSNRDDLLSGIEIFEDDAFRCLENIDEAAKLLYKMRSDFVHNAKMATFTSPRSMTPLITIVGSSSYMFMMNIEYYMFIFEKSFIKYWLEQTNS